MAEKSKSIYSLLIVDYDSFSTDSHPDVEMIDSGKHLATILHTADAYLRKHRYKKKQEWQHSEQGSERICVGVDSDHLLIKQVLLQIPLVENVCDHKDEHGNDLLRYIPDIGLNYCAKCNSVL